MTAIDDKLSALLAEDLPPARDASFRIAVLAKLERRRLLIKLAVLTAVCALAAVALPGFAPQVMDFLINAPGLGLGVGVAAAAVVASLLFSRRGLRN